MCFEPKKLWTFWVRPVALFLLGALSEEKAESFDIAARLWIERKILNNGFHASSNSFGWVLWLVGHLALCLKGGHRTVARALNLMVSQ